MDKYRNYELEWQAAFQEAEMNPPEKLWNKINAVLTSKESGKNRKMFLFLQLMTAASVVFGLMIGVIGYLGDNSLKDPEKYAVDQKIEGDSKKSSSEGISDNKKSDINLSSVEVKNAQKDLQGAKKLKENITNDIPIANKLSPSQINLHKDEHGFTPMQIKELETVEWTFKSDLPLLDPYIHRVPAFPELIKDSKDKGELWAGIRMSAGSFNPNFGSDAEAASPAFSSDIDPSNEAGSGVNRTTQSPGFSYSFGFNVGKKIAHRWILQSGVQYTVQSSDGSSTAFSENLLTREKTPLYLYNETGSISQVNFTDPGF